MIYNRHYSLNHR